MPSWGEILGELQQSAEGNQGRPDFDSIRRRYLTQLHTLTERDLILYSTNWLPGGAPGLSITLEDMQGMMEVCRGLKGPNLDLVLHSPGGSPEATASVVHYLRQKFSHIRVFVPLAAMSAATMWALSCDEIVMAQGAFPARAIIRQFERARDECAQDPAKLGAWVPILQQYGPALLQFCEDAEVLARRLVVEWLQQYMFAEREDKEAKATEVADYFAAYEEHRSHALGIDRETARGLGLNVTFLESDQALQDAVLSVHHATVHTFTGTGVRKIVENQLGRAYIQIGAQFEMQAILQPPPPAI